MSSTAPTPQRRAARLALGIALLAALPAAVGAQETHGAHGARPAAAGRETRAALLTGLGTHHHRITTTSALAQRYFDQGLALAYAFNHDEAHRSFREAARLDPHCAMCEWGAALVLGPNINAPMDTAKNAAAYAGARRALVLAARATAPERAYAQALVARYAPAASANRAPLDSAYARAARAVADRFPRDADAAALYAEAQMNLSPWAYWSRDSAPRPGTAGALAALDRAMRLDPKNPGACHYYIHLV